jgi:translation initiation factor 1A
MVKNTTGGSKTKGQARKFTSSRQSFALRLSNDDLEVYAQVTKMLGNGMCHVLCIDKKIRLCHIRGKFRGRGKRDNLITINSLILVGLREWDENKEEAKKLQQCDLLEVYSEIDKENLKTKVKLNWNIFDTEEKKYDTKDFEFSDEKTSEYENIIQLAANANKSEKKIYTIEEEEINVDDI